MSENILRILVTNKLSLASFDEYLINAHLVIPGGFCQVSVNGLGWDGDGGGFAKSFSCQTQLQLRLS